MADLRSTAGDAGHGRPPVDFPRLERAVRETLLALGQDVAREGLRDTPRRVAQMYAEVFSGLDEDPYAILATGFEEEEPGEQVVIARDIPFWSMCEHHLLPFFGRASVGYIPNGRLAGISKFGRALDALARRPQMQERLTAQWVDAIHRALDADGVAALVEAEHLCTVMRGVRKPGSAVVTSAVRGAFSRGVSREELLSLVRREAP